MNKTTEGHCLECGLKVVPGEHTGHKAHLTGAWVCHDCGALCDADDEWEDGDDTALFDDGYNAGLEAGRKETAVLLQVLLDAQARRMRSLRRWADDTDADRGSERWAFKSGQFDHAHETANYLLGKAVALGVNLDETVLDAAVKDGDWL